MSQADPFLDEGMKGWLNRVAWQDHWRLAWMDVEDVVQEVYFCYCKCKRAYPQLVSVKNPNKDQRKEFQALLKATWHNHVRTLAAKLGSNDVSPVSQLVSADATEVAVWERVIPPQPETGSIAILLARAPKELQEFFRLLTTDGLDLLAFARRQVGRKQVRETTNEHYCRLLGLDPATVDLASQLKSYLQQG